MHKIIELNQKEILTIGGGTLQNIGLNASNNITNTSESSTSSDCLKNILLATAYLGIIIAAGYLIYDAKKFDRMQGK